MLRDSPRCMPDLVTKYRVQQNMMPEGPGKNDRENASSDVQDGEVIFKVDLVRIKAALRVNPDDGLAFIPGERFRAKRRRQRLEVFREWPREFARVGPFEMMDQS